MRIHLFQPLTLVILLVSLGTLACDLTTLVGSVGGTKPTITIQSPATGSQFREGDEIAVQSTASDPAGIVRVELAVDGATVRTDVPPIPRGQPTFTLIQKWTATAGTHTLSVRAFNASGAASDHAFIAITVVPAPVPTAAPTAPIGMLPTPLQPTAPLPPAVTPILPLPAASPTTRPPTRVPATATRRAPPGVYTTAIRLDPAEPKRGQFVTFYVTFLNTTGEPKPYRWYVKVFEPDKRHAFGETAKSDHTFPVGTSEFPSVANWHVGPGDCMQLIARVFWIDAERNIFEFPKPEGGSTAHGFTVCP